MAIYTVLAPTLRDGTSMPTPMDLVFVKERVSWPALFFGPLWLIFRRMWLVLVLYLVALIVIGFVAAKIGGPIPGILLVLGHLLFAIEGNELRRWTLRRRGYGTIGVVEGRGMEEAEIRFFARAEESSPAGVIPVPPVPPVPPTPPAPLAKPPSLGPMPPSAEAGDVVGLFPSPGGAT
jgi:hypothetical protein